MKLCYSVNHFSCIVRINCSGQLSYNCSYYILIEYMILLNIKFAVVSSSHIIRMLVYTYKWFHFISNINPSLLLCSLTVLIIFDLRQSATLLPVDQVIFDVKLFTGFLVTNNLIFTPVVPFLISQLACLGRKTGTILHTFMQKMIVVRWRTHWFWKCYGDFCIDPQLQYRCILRVSTCITQITPVWTLNVYHVFGVQCRIERAALKNVWARYLFLSKQCRPAQE